MEDLHKITTHKQVEDFLKFSASQAEAGLLLNIVSGLNTPLTFKHMDRKYTAEYFSDRKFIEIKYNGMYMAIVDLDRKLLFHLENPVNYIHRMNIGNVCRCFINGLEVPR